MGQQLAYAEDMQKVFDIFTAPERAAEYSTPEQIAEVVYEAATDDEDRHTYIAGKDAEAFFAQRKEAGADAFRKGIRQMMFGD